jgi:hypothetical protein
MKNLFTLSYCLFLISYSLFSQSVGIGTNTPNASAQLDVSATNKGILVPRVTHAQMLAIASPANGLLVYNTDSACFAYRNASAWVFVKGNATASNDWSIKGNAGTDTAIHFIGTTDNQPVVVRQNNVRAGLLTGSGSGSRGNTSWGVAALNPATTGLYNTALGADALYFNVEGSGNTATGSEALFRNTSGGSNTATGAGALFSNTEGHFNTAIGAKALRSNTQGWGNTALGLQANYFNTTGSTNIAIGFSTLLANTVGYSNVAIGVYALYRNTNRSNLVAIGDSALYNNGLGADSPYHAVYNTALGSKALFANTDGYKNTGLGSHSLVNNTSGNENTATGYNALLSNTVGSRNTATGVEAMLNNITGIQNVAIGQSALRYNLAGYGNTAVGYNAGFNTTGDANVFLGHNAGAFERGSNTLYIDNVGRDSNSALLYGQFESGKLIINDKLGIGMLPLTVPALNEYAQLQVKQKNTQSGIGITRANNEDRWEFYVSNSNSAFELFYNNALKGSFSTITGAYTQASDSRLKKDITVYAPVLDKLNQLQAFRYHYLDNKNEDPFSTGFIAQEVQKLFPDAVSELDMKNGETRLGINYQYFTVLAIKGLQEQNKIIETQANNLQQQQQRIEKLEAMMKALLPKN